MPIIRSKTESNYFVMHNATAQDNALSWEARGMLAYLLSKPEGWKTNMTDLSRQSSAGRDKCYRVMDELLAAGYVERRARERQKGKKQGFDYFVYDRPTVAKPDRKDADLSVSPDTVQPDTVQPDTVQPDTANTDAYKEQRVERTDLERTERDSLCVSGENAPGGYPEGFETFWKGIIGQYHKTPLGNKREAFNEWQRHAKQILTSNLGTAWMSYLAECRRTDTSTKHVCRWLKYRGWEQDYGPPMSIEDMARKARMEKWRREDEGHQDRNRELGYQDAGKRALAGQSQT